MTSHVLIIETATEDGSVAIASGGRLAAEVAFASRDPDTGARTESLAPALTKLLVASGLRASDLTAVVCSAGPGGFTSLRAAAALAKGVCAVVGIPMFAAPSLAVLAWSSGVAEGRYIAAMAAGRNEWFAADVAIDSRGRANVDGPVVLGRAELEARAARTNARLIGRAMDVEAVARAAAVVPHLDEVMSAGAVDLDSWEPEYGRLAEAQVKWEAAHGRPLMA